ncbi:F-box only protein 39-like [Brachyistius frenatus]|uniref:F-box only protein 39-like n=1 Tax=Brachyistius frenatus TaxID=100188 RepID=UPI0037E72BCF
MVEEESFYEDTDTGDETGEDPSDDSRYYISEKMSEWDSLPHVCLQHVFRLLPDRDRRSAALVCHHWHKVMRSPSLWRTRSFHFTGRLNKYKQSEYNYAVGYALNLGVYLERLEVSVWPPRKRFIAKTLEETISGLLAALISVQAQLRSFSLVKLELDRTSWTSRNRKALMMSLHVFLQRGASKLTSISLNWMQNSIHQGLELLSALLHSQRRVNPRYYISSLDLEGFFSMEVNVRLNPIMHHSMRNLQGLTELRLSYSCLSDELLMALQSRHTSGQLSSTRNGNSLQTLSFHCALIEPHLQVVRGGSWASLVSSCPDLRVKFSVDQLIDTEVLARMLLPEIPLREYSMTAHYDPEEECSAKPVLCDMLPQYSRSLQNLNLDMTNCDESLDEELLGLVKVCECLEQLTVCAFLEVNTVNRLLHMRLTEKTSLNKISVTIYTIEDDPEEQEDQLEEILCSYLHLPPELEFYATLYPFV